MPGYTPKVPKPSKRNGKHDLHAVNQALLMSAARHAQADKLVAMAAQEVLKLLDDTGILKFTVDLKTRKVQTTSESINTMEV